MTYKTITLKTKVPTWAKWDATDKHGAVYVYKDKPHIPTRFNPNDGWKPTPERESPFLLIHQHNVPPRDWKQSLRKI